MNRLTEDRPDGRGRSQRLADILKKVCRIHKASLRSSLLNDLKVPVKIAQEQLGHASITTTLNIYTHVVDASHRRAVEDVEQRLFGDVDPNGPKSPATLETETPATDSVN
jgi:integrase